MIDLEQMLARLGERARVCIWTHNHPDPDAIASAFGLKQLFESRIGCRATLAYEGIIFRVNNKAMVDVLRIPLHKGSELRLADFDQHCLVDSQPGLGNNSFPQGLHPFLVLDHHPGPPATADFADLRPEVGATATMVTQYLQRLRLPIGKELATALYYGIGTDTDDLSRDSSELDKEMFYALFPLIDPEKLARIEKPDLPRDYYHDVGDAILAARLYGAVLVSDLGEMWSPEMPAEMADFLLRMERIDTTLVHGSHGGELHFSMRTSRRGRDLGELALRMVEERGTAGGHNRAAGGLLADTPQNVRFLRERFFACFCLDELSFSTILGTTATPLPGERQGRGGWAAGGDDGRPGA